MRKTFQLTHPRHKPPQALALVKNQVRKYIKRERRKELPEDVDYWDFDCKVGVDEATAEVAHIAELIPKIDAVAQLGVAEVYVEVLVKHGHRSRRSGDEAEASDVVEE